MTESQQIRQFVPVEYRRVGLTPFFTRVYPDISVQIAPQRSTRNDPWGAWTPSSPVRVRREIGGVVLRYPIAAMIGRPPRASQRRADTGGYEVMTTEALADDMARSRSTNVGPHPSGALARDARKT